MPPTLQIDTAQWPSSGAATEITTRGGAATGLLNLDGNWTHGEDSEGRKYIEHANGAEDSINIIDSGDVFGSQGDRVRVQAGIMLVKNNDISYTTVGTAEERFFDTLTGERSILQLRHGTNFYSGEGWRFTIAEFGPSATVTNYPATAGLDFGTLYEFATECQFDDPGWIRIYLNGIQIGAVDGDQTGVNADRMVQWKIPDVPNDDVRYRVYGDRDGYISVIEDDFEYIPQYTQEQNSDFAFRFMDLQPSDIASDRGFWVWSDAAEVTPTAYATGGTNPGRFYAAVTSTGSTATLRENFESSIDDKYNMIVINGIKINAGGSLSIVISTDGTELGRIIFTGENVQIKHGTDAAENIMTYIEDDNRYCLRLNRYDNRLRVGLEDMTSAFSSSATIQLADFSKTNKGGLKTEHYEEVSLICDDCEVDGVAGLKREFASLVSSYVAADVNALTPTQEMWNRLSSLFPKPLALNAFPGFMASNNDLTEGYTFTTVGRSGNNITNFVANNGSALGLFAGHTFILLEWIINDFSPVRGSEAGIIGARNEVFDAMSDLVDICISNDIKLWTGIPVPPPAGGSSDWQSYASDNYIGLTADVKDLLIEQNNPSILSWSEFDVTSADYFTAGSDDVHFDTDGEDLYYLRFTSNLSGIGTLPRSLSFSISPGNTSAPTFTIDGNSYPTRQLDGNLESIIGNPFVQGPATITFEPIDSNFEIRYTINGKNPTSKSTLYTGTIVSDRNLTGSDNTIIKARIYQKNNPENKSRIMKISFRVF